MKVRSAECGVRNGDMEGNDYLLIFTGFSGFYRSNGDCREFLGFLF
jgi:hypothetical protein